jgi:hypothetical protein
MNSRCPRDCPAGVYGCTRALSSRCPMHCAFRRLDRSPYGGRAYRRLPAGPEPQPRSRGADGRGRQANGSTGHGKTRRCAQLPASWQRRAYPVRLDGAGCRHHPRQRVAAYRGLPATVAATAPVVPPAPQTVAQRLADMLVGGSVAAAARAARSSWCLPEQPQGQPAHPR